MDQDKYAVDDPRLKQAVYAVRATHEEQHFLWVEHSKEAISLGWGSPEHKSRKARWESHRQGWATTVGTLELRDGSVLPVVVAVSFAEIAGKLILFWECISMVAHYGMAEAWLRKNVPCYETHHTNATNFGHVLSFVEGA